MQTQAALRRAGRNARASLTAEERDDASQAILDKLFSAPFFRSAQLVGCYLSSGDEVNTWPVFERAWRMKKRIFAPVLKKKRRMQFQEITASTELQQNRMGIYEPGDGESVDVKTLDIVITPVVAFDKSNRRVGLGGGYFDTTFSFLNHRRIYFHPKLVGVAFACQEVAEIAPNPWDIRLFGTITD